MAPTSETETVGPTAFEMTGTGYPVVLVHGVGLDRRIWRGQVPVLAEAFRVIAYDMLGHGESADPPGRRRLADFVGQLEALIDHLRLPEVAIVGFSMGGLVARAFTLAFSERVSRLALLSTVYRRSVAEQAAVKSRLRMAEKNGIATLAAPALRRWLTPTFQARGEETVAAIRERLEANRPEAFLAAYRIFADADAALAAFLDERGIESDRAIDCPLLVMTGADDSGSTPAMARRLATDSPKARCTILPGLRHLTLVERPDAVNRPLVRFLREIETLQ